MAWSSATYITAFDAEAGDISTLATDAQKRIWFNEGQQRLLKLRPRYADHTWAAADRIEALATDFAQLDQIQYATGYPAEQWRVFGSSLYHEDSDGASAAGSARIFYWAFWPDLTDVIASVGDAQQDYCCLYYALHRFYKKLSSNRAYYKRYATLVGQNAVSMQDLQDEADRYYQDFLDARGDQTPLPVAHFFPVT